MTAIAAVAALLPVAQIGWYGCPLWNCAIAEICHPPRNASAKPPRPLSHFRP
jgi:hypothetical protein